MFRHIHKQKLFPEKSHLLKSKKMFSFLPIRKMGNKIIKTNKYAVIKLYIDGIINGKPVKILFFMENYLIDELKTILLINNNKFKL